MTEEPSIVHTMSNFLMQESPRYDRIEHDRRIDSVQGCRILSRLIEYALRERGWSPTCLVPASALSYRPTCEYLIARYNRWRSSVATDPGDFTRRPLDPMPNISWWPSKRQHVVIVSTSPGERYDLALRASRAHGASIVGVLAVVDDRAGENTVLHGDTIVPYVGFLRTTDLHQQTGTAQPSLRAAQ